jgi:beta-lactam-binding protein with PASTA domain
VIRGFTIKVPNLVGMSLPDAEKALTDAGLTSQVISNSIPSPTVPVGKVAATDPAAGTAVPSGSTVKIYTSSGPPPPPPTPTGTPTPTTSPSP